MKINKAQITLFVALLLSNAIILFSPSNWAWLRFPVVIAFVFVLPGWAWLPTLGWMQTRRAIERLVLLVGVSSLLGALVLYFTVLLPGPFTEPPVLIALNLLSLVGLVSQSFVTKNSGDIPLLEIKTRGGEDLTMRGKSSPPRLLASSPFHLEWPSRTVLLILVGIIALAMFTRFTRLGYSEFHEDELENMRLIVRAFKGEEYVPFIDSKGPVHWLLPAALWYANGWINEALARVPFAVASVMLVPLMYALGRRMSSGRDSAGLIAAAIIMLNGFYVSLARHVENRVLIVFWGALAVWFAYRYFKENLNHFALYAAFTLAVGFIAHPTVMLYVPAVAFVLLAKDWRTPQWTHRWRWWVGGVATFMGVSALFYVPYLLSPEIGLVYQYFAEERVGTSLLYNRIDSLLGESELYSSLYYGPILVLLMFWLLIRNFYKVGGWGLALLAVLAALVISTALFPPLWDFGVINLAFVPSALLTLAVLLLPRTNVETKTSFLWFAVPFGVLLFMAQDASNHIQIAFTGLTLLAAFGLQDLWSVLGSSQGKPSPVRRVARGVLVVALVLAGMLAYYYQYLLFNAPVTTYWQVKEDYTYNPNSIYGYVYRSIPRPRKIISNPRLGGWKAVGYLWETGQLSGDFRSINESFAVPIWYTFQTPRSCYTDPQNYWTRRDWQKWPEEEQQVLENGYGLTRVVLVDQQPKLHLFERGVSADEPEVLDVNEYSRLFDLLATPDRFAQNETISQLASLNFGDILLLRGYDLPGTARPGDLLPVTVFWDSLAPTGVRFRAFMHLIGPDGTMLSQHDDDPACRLLTTEMRPGMDSFRQFRLPIDPNLSPGKYSVVLGLYHPDTFERLDIWDNQAQASLGNSIVLGQVTVE